MNLEPLIVREIENNKSISFARFMELALYAPELGYYEQKERVGRGGDFYTSVSVGPFFGELLAVQFADWLNNLPTQDVQIVESGANDGQLAHDILAALRKVAPALFDRICYCILEPSAKHEQWQREVLKEFSNVRWVRQWNDLENFSGVIFSNELLDAFPFHRLQWSAQSKSWHELKVGWSGTHFLWQTEAAPSDLPGVPQIPTELAEVLPDGFQTEICPLALEWWKIAAGKLIHGKIMAIDYGLEADEFFHPERSRGTARSYKRHHAGGELLADPGEQDITCHVNFTAFIEAGESTGLKTEFFGSQAKFLTGILEKQLRSRPDMLDRKAVAQFQTLTHPAHLGTKFKVLVQSQQFLSRNNWSTTPLYTT